MGAGHAAGMAELAGVDPAGITSWSQRSTQLRQWVANNLAVVDGGQPTPAQLATAQKATRPAKPEQLAWVQLQQIWCEDARGLTRIVKVVFVIHRPFGAVTQMTRW